ncbi:MAG: hypothetical protein FIA90_13255 [candidate division NC10 bacterium]|nr:hypothetical protein [candidate division NC10 bacterium]
MLHHPDERTAGVAHVVRRTTAHLAGGVATLVAGVAERAAHLAYHIVVVVASAAIALSLPTIARSWVPHVVYYWSLIEDEKTLILSVEITVAVLLMMLMEVMGRRWRDRRFAQVARRAGLLGATRSGRRFAARRIRRMKERQGLGRDLMLIGSTGFRTFVEPNGDLHSVLHHCREAKIMLLDPESEGARARARAILHPDVTEAHLREQISKSIEFLRTLKEVRKTITLKLYQDPPFLKLAILGDYIWMRYYPSAMDVEMMPEYLFQHVPHPESLYTPLYQYFLTRWNDPDIPEYDFERNALVYRDQAGKEGRLEPFDRSHTMPAGASTPMRLLAPSHARQAGIPDGLGAKNPTRANPSGNGWTQETRP